MQQKRQQRVHDESHRIYNVATMMVFQMIENYNMKVLYAIKADYTWMEPKFKEFDEDYREYIDKMSMHHKIPQDLIYDDIWL